MFGESSPLAKLEGLDAKVLLIGVGFDKCTCLHLAEYRTGAPKTDNSFAALVDGNREWTTVSDVAVNDESFVDLGSELMKEGNVVEGNIGAAKCYLFSLREAVRFAERWMVLHRTST
jgi:aminoglycoside 3-N-acetyltransferase